MYNVSAKRMMEIILAFNTLKLHCELLLKVTKVLPRVIYASLWKTIIIPLLFQQPHGTFN